MKHWYLLLSLLGLGACAGPDSHLTVKQFYLRDQVEDDLDDPMLRGEKSRLLHGAVSMEERRGKLGQYYTVLWNDADGAGSGPVEVRYDYRQGSSGSRIKTRSETFSAETSSGKAVFSVIGDDYFKRGKVIGWKVTLLRGSRVLSTKQSYMWE
ncbi:MAG: hypothetical protein EOP87_01355 [Verrucomicrobiaceae bacterium]|nr:MAG: hypothetical protein EOP87_01355 [Verrucomicrobiaceae bacterium]